jgi:glycosyltransferase involved in cell wall biosynthesis
MNSPDREGVANGSSPMPTIPVGTRLLVRAVGDRRVASTRYRVLAHLEALRRAGFVVEVETRPAPLGRWLRSPARLAELVRDGFGRPRADLLLIQRKTYPPLFARQLGRSPLPRVFDFDDALYLPPPSWPQDKRSRERYRRNFDATVRSMHVVICGNHELANRVDHPRTHVLPTAVDHQLFTPQAIGEADGPVAGWVGHSDNLPFLEALAGPLRELARRHPGFRLKVVADRAPLIDGVEVEFEPWTLESEISCFGGIAIGLMPLADSPWTRAKCAFKLLQYMALGIPAVAAPVGMNNEVVDDGVDGLLAASGDQWFAAVDRLLRDRELRRRLAMAGRETVERRYSLSVTSPRLIAILGEVLETVGPRKVARGPG